MEFSQKPTCHGEVVSLIRIVVLFESTGHELKVDTRAQICKALFLMLGLRLPMIFNSSRHITYVTIAGNFAHISFHFLPRVVMI